LQAINVELQYEQDQEIITVLSQQREVFDKILAQKQTGEKNSLRTTENEMISQLQNQMKSLEKLVDNKFNLILKTIETSSQNQSQNQSQSQSQDQSQGQSQDHSQSQVQNQLQSQAKTYAQVAASNPQAKENSFQITSQKVQKQKEKELEKQKYRQRRLIIQVDKEVAESFSSYTLRNEINDRFFSKENISCPVVATATKSFTSQSIVLTTMPDFSADFLLQKKAVWEDIFSGKAKKIEKDNHWSKVVIHGVPVKPFLVDEGLSLLKDEIETFNPDLKLLQKPIWLCSEENRQVKRHASVLIAVGNAEQAQLAIEKRLCVAGNWLIAQKYKVSAPQTQCQNCQRLGHATRACVLQPRC
jgi:hypothetical protein